MNTFDVFDTLIARRTITSDSIFRRMENEFSLPNFFNTRKSVDTGGRSIFQIYQALANLNVIDVKDVYKYVDIEIQYEIENSFPITKNMNKVNHGDVLISDMYLTNWAILRMVKACGLDKEVTVYQSNGDKRNGTIWDTIKDRHDGVHLGDNVFSDIDQANIRNIKTEYCEEHKMLRIEDRLVSIGLKSLALLCRETRLRSQGNYHNILAANVNLPMLFIMSELIHRSANKKMIFLGRDCQLLEKVYSAYYEKSVYLPFSRKVAYAQKDIAVKYLNQYNLDNHMFFDISSTGATWEHLQSNIPITVAIYSDTYHYTQSKPVLPKDFSYLFTNSTIGTTNIILEMFNCGNHGHLSQIELIGNKFFKCHFDSHELHNDVIEFVQSPIIIASSLSPHYKDEIRKEISEVSEEALRQLFAYLVNFLCQQTHILDPNFVNKESQYLNKVAN